MQFKWPLTFILLAIAFFSATNSFSQSTLWAQQIGGNQVGDRGHATRVAPNGNVFVTGAFKGTTDLDPSAAVYNITSNGAEDIFLACYSPTGGFLWGFNAGGVQTDAGRDIEFDAQGNVFLIGYFRGQNVDFDPSAAVNTLSDNGLSGGNVYDGGDGFIVKYSSTGAYQWAFNVGGAWVYDFLDCIALDELGNVYIGGTIVGPVDIDPSAAVYNIDGINGKSYLIKYTNNGQLVWGKSFLSPGGTGVNCGVLSMRVKAGIIYVCGFFQFTADFDPNAGVVSATASGYDPYVAKYDTAGNYLFSDAIQTGSGVDIAREVAIDPAGNLYVTGTTAAGTGTMIFGNGTFPVPGSSGGDMFMAKYSPSGTVLWAKVIGSSGLDEGYSIAYNNGSIFTTGAFSGTVDFDPSAAVNTLSSSGGLDAFVGQYDLNANYICAFRFGSTGKDQAWGINADLSNNIYVAGIFQNTVDFDPSAALYNMSSVSGSEDAFLAKYAWLVGNNLFTVTGDTICAGQQAYFTLTDTAGAGPFTISLNDGFNTYTYNNVISGVPVALVPSPVTTTVYTWTVNGQSLGMCSNAITTGSFTVLVSPQPVANAGQDIAVCNNTFVQLNGSGGTTYSWTPSSVLNNPNIANPTLTVIDTTLTFTLITSNSFGCTDTDQVNVSVHSSPVANAGNDVTICASATTQLQGSGGGSYLWYPGTSLSNVNIANPVFSGTTTTVLSMVVTNQYNCKDTDQVQVTVNPQPIANAGADIALCNSSFVQLNGSGGSTYSWTPSSVLNNPNIANPTLTVTDTTLTFTLITSNSFGCTDTDQVNVSVHQSPVANAGPDTTICGGSSIQLQGSGGGSYLWYPGTGLNNTTIANPVFSGTGTALLSMVVTNQYNCRDTDQVIVAVLPQPAANAGPDVSACSSTFIQLNGSGGNTYSWTPSSVLNNAAIANPTMTVTDTTLIFTLIVTNNAGCSDTDQVTISVHQGIANANAGPDTTVCPGMSVQLQGTGGLVYNWFPATDLNNPNISNPIYTGNTAATITLVVTDQYNCSDTDQVLVSMAPEPIADAGVDTQVCANVAVQLQGAGGNTYNWYPVTGMTGSNTATPIVTITGATTYYLIATNTSGCSDTDAVQLSIIAVPSFGIAPQQDICPADSVKLYASGGGTYLWYPDANISATNTDTVTVWPAVSTTYYVVITEPVCNYADTESVLVNLHQLPPVKITKATPIGCGQPYGLLEATGAVQYLWTPSATLSADNVASTASLTKVETWYTVMGTDQFGCVAYDSVLMRILSDDLSGLFIPTAFTPNADGKNDCFRMKMPPQVDEFELHIYNRYGNNVFNADDVTDCWDGTYKGEPSDVGVYYYYYKLKSNACGKEKEGKGDITLLR